MRTSIPTVDALLEARRLHSFSLLLAFCTICAQPRSTTRPRNRDWNSEMGDLKCDACGKVTRHALIRGVSHDENRYALALGMPDSYNGKPNERFMDEYRQGFKVNPLLNHWRWDNDAEKARDRGEDRVRALCGEMMKLSFPKGDNPGRTDGGRQVEPEGDTLDGRDYDPDDHGEWRYMDCPNCLRVWHHVLARRRRKTLATLMTTALAELLDPPRAGIYDDHSAALIEALKAVHREGSR